MFPDSFQGMASPAQGVRRKFGEGTPIAPVPRHYPESSLYVATLNRHLRGARRRSGSDGALNRPSSQRRRGIC